MPGGGGGPEPVSGRGRGDPGIRNALQALRLLSVGDFSSKKPCMDFLAELLNGSGSEVVAIDLARSIATFAGEASTMGYVYDGPSSDTPLDSVKFPSAAQEPIKTVAHLFKASPGLQALSQFNGSAIWIRADDWSGFLSPFGGSQPNAYAMGTLLHEFLHKNTSAGGFRHESLKTALRVSGRNPADFSGQNGISRELGAICF